MVFLGTLTKLSATLANCVGLFSVESLKGVVETCSSICEQNAVCDKSRDYLHRYRGRA